MKGDGADHVSKTRVFYIIVNKTDAPHFEYLRRNAPSVDHMWGLRDYDAEEWETVRTNDLVYMWTDDSVTIPLCGRVSGTSLDPHVAKSWIRDEWINRTRIIYFSHLRHINIIYKDFCRHTGIIFDHPKTLFRAPDDGVAGILRGWPINDPIFTPPQSTPPVDLVSPPDSVAYDTIRPIRDTKKSRELKEMYGNKCQVCGYSLEAGAGFLHSEVHHLRPLHEGGSDTHDNMIVLCPQHHAEFDYGAMHVDKSGNVFGRAVRDKAKLSFTGNHRLNPENVRREVKNEGGLA